MIASWGMRAWRTLTVEKMAAPMNVKTRLDPVDPGPVRVLPREGEQDRDRGAERGDLRERQVDEDDAALHDVDAEVGVDAGQDQAGHEGSGEEPEDVECPCYLAPVSLMVATSRLMS